MVRCRERHSGHYHISKSACVANRHARICERALHRSARGNGQFTATLSWLKQDHFATRLARAPACRFSRCGFTTGWTRKWSGFGQAFGKNDVLTAGAYFAHEHLNGGNEGRPSRETLATSFRDEWYINGGNGCYGRAEDRPCRIELRLKRAGGLRYPLDTHLVAKTSLGLGFRPASFEELYRNEGLVVGNPVSIA